jgi:hypothetical protein
MINVSPGDIDHRPTDQRQPGRYLFYFIQDFRQAEALLSELDACVREHPEDELGLFVHNPQALFQPVLRRECGTTGAAVRVILEPTERCLDLVAAVRARKQQQRLPVDEGIHHRSPSAVVDTETAPATGGLQPDDTTRLEVTQ